MKIKIKNYALACLIFAVFEITAKAKTVDEFADKYYVQFDTDGTGMSMARTQFMKEVPLSEQAEISAKILDRALAANPPNYRLAYIILWLLSSPEFKASWNAHLEKLIHEQVKNPNGNIRSNIANLLAEKQKDIARDTVLSFQNDSDDEVRASLMSSIKKWPDAEPIYQKYIQAHESDPNYAKSVEAAKGCIVLNRQILKNNGS